MRQFYIYILSSKSRRLYTGVTNSLPVRLYQHANGFTKFTAKYQINRLVYFEVAGTAIVAIAREKQIKGFDRRKRIALIESANPAWDDLSHAWERR